MTRAWPIVALIRRKTRITQNQAIASRRIFCSVVSFSSGLAGFVFLVFMRHRDRSVGLHGSGVFRAGIFEQLAVGPAFANFELHKVGGINTRVTRRAEGAFGVSDRLF